MEYLQGWSVRDRGLAEGLLVYEASIGPHGVPWRDALDPDNEGWFEVDEQIDTAQAALDQWNKDHRGKDDVAPGTRLRVVDTRPKG